MKIHEFAEAAIKYAPEEVEMLLLMHKNGNPYFIYGLIVGHVRQALNTDYHIDGVSTDMIPDVVEELKNILISSKRNKKINNVLDDET
jgi:hypothetical protein